MALFPVSSPHSAPSPSEGQPAARGCASTRRIPLAAVRALGLLAVCCLAWALGDGFGREAHAQSVAAGAALWTSQGCNGCHGVAPVPPQRNAADMRAVLDHAITNNYGGVMAAFAGLTVQERTDLVAYIGSVVPAISQPTGFQTPTTVSVADHITLGTGTFTSVAVVSGPSSGITAPFVGTDVTYTPAPAFSGTDSFTYRATGPAGNSSTRTVTITVGAPGAPAAAARTVVVGFNTAAAIDLTGSISGVTTGIAIASVPAHGTVSVSGNTVTYTPTAGYSGPDSFTYSAVGPGGTSAPATVSITVATLAPGGGPVTITVPLNTPTTVDLAPLITGSAITGVVVVTSPAHGSTAVNGTRVTYTPVANYFGPDSFTYSAFGNAGVSPAALVNVIVVGRPDPTRDPTVVGVLAAQADAARRFARTQISNFQRRLESLHRGSRSASNASIGPDPQANRSAAQSPTAAGIADHRAEHSGETLTRSALQRVNNAPAAPRIGGEGAPEAKLFPFLNDAFSLLATGSVNLASLSPRSPGRDPAAGGADGVNFWLEGVANFGSRDATGGRSGLDFSTHGVSAGVDRRFSDQWVLGVGVGYARDNTEIGTDGSDSRARSYSITGYASYQPTPTTFVDGLIGIGALDFDSQRYIAPIDAFARADRDGYQIFGSLAAGYEHRAGALLVSPYARLDYAADRLKQSSETGAGQYALTYFSQTTPSLQGALGLRAESVHDTSFGWAIPRIRVEYRHDFQGERLASIAYADLIGGPRFAVGTGALSRDSIAVGIGSDFVMRNGLTFGVDYQLVYSSSQETNYAVRMRLSKDFGGGGSSLRGLSSSAGKPLDIQVDAGYMFDDNVTRANNSTDQLADRAYSLNLSKVAIFPIIEHLRALVTGYLGGERFHDYNGLSRIFAGVQGELQYRASAEFSAPTFAVFARTFADLYESDLRSGHRYSAGVSVRQPVTDRIGLFAALAHNERHGRSGVFNLRDNSLRLNVDYAATPTGTLYLGGEYRRGDAVSSGRASLASIDIAKVFVRDDAFPGEFFSYRFEARTLLTTLGYNLGLGPRDSLDFSWRRAESTPRLRPSFQTSTSSYVANQFSVVYLTRF